MRVYELNVYLSVGVNANLESNTICAYYCGVSSVFPLRTTAISPVEMFYYSLLLFVELQLPSCCCELKFCVKSLAKERFDTGS